VGLLFGFGASLVEPLRAGLALETKTPVGAIPCLSHFRLGVLGTGALAAHQKQPRLNRSFGDDSRITIAKRKPGQWARLSPRVGAYDFPSRTRESECVNASLASVAILRRLKGMWE